jgi:biopolymer transport protein ExbB/TolQ
MAKKKQLKQVQEHLDRKRLQQPDESRQVLFDNKMAAQVSMVTSAGIAFSMTIVLCAVLFPLRDTTLGELILKRGWVPYVLVFMTAWSFAILFLKSRMLKNQKESMKFNLLPTKISATITIESVPTFEQHIRTLSVNHKGNFLVTRLLRGLSHYEARGNHAETAEILTSQSDIDATTVDSSYTIVKVFIWAIPILGFIGTVVGISDAVGGFAGELGAADDMAVLKDKLGMVTSGLGVAFDTTLLALIMSVMVMFPASVMQMREEELLNAIDDYCNENFLKRLEDSSSETAHAHASQTELLAQLVALQEQQLAMMRHLVTH